MIEVNLKNRKVCEFKFKYKINLVNYFRSLNIRKYNDSTGCWEIPITFSEAVINTLIEVGYEVKVDKRIYTVLKEIKEEKEKVLNKKVLKDLEFDLKKYPFKTTPFEHQLIGVERILQEDNLLLADEMGLGKTWQAINAAIIRKDKYNVDKCLILCGINSVKYNWQKEVEIHSAEKAIVFEGKSVVDRIKLIEAWSKDNDNFFGILNVESLLNKDLVALIEKLCKKKIGMIIIDEVHKCKNPLSKRGKAIQKFRGCKYKLIMTGTPLMNRVDELYNPLKFLGIEKGTFTNFKAHYCVMGGFMNRQIVSYKNLDEINIILNNCMLRRKKDEVLDLPEKVYKSEYLELEKENLKLYKGVNEELIKNIDEILLNTNPLTKLLRLRQITGGLLGNSKVKLNRLLEIIEELDQEQLIIFSNWSSEVDLVIEFLNANGITNVEKITGDVGVKDRQDLVDKFQNKEIRILVGTITAMGTGLTLTNASCAVYMDKAWTPADNRQSEDRIHRIGSIGNKTIITFIIKDTVDEYLERLLKEKEDLFEKVVENKATIMDKEYIIKKLLGVK